MTWFYASSVSVTNGATVVSVNAGDDIAIAQGAGGLIIGSQPPVEIKRTYLDGGSNKKIELLKPWPYGSQTNQPAAAFPTDGDLAAATAVLKQLIDGFTLASQAEAQAGTENTKPMTALRVKQAMDALLGTASKLTSTTSTTDAVQGRALRVGDFGIGASGNTAVYSGDLSAISAAGIYSGGPSTTGGPAGVSLDGAKIVHLKWADPNSSSQLVYTYSGPSYSRNITGGTPLPWRQDYNTANVLGTVAFSGGVNSGGIIERGSNSNGEYVKFADGTLFCWTLASPNSNALSTPAGSVWRTGLLNWTFPAAFINPPTVTGADKGTLGYVTPAGDTTNTYAEYIVVGPVAGPISQNTRILAVGRWR